MRRHCQRSGVLAVTATIAFAIFSFGAVANAHIQNDEGDGIEWSYSDSAHGYWRQPVSRESGGGSEGLPTVYIDYGEPGEPLYCPQENEEFACTGDDGAEYNSIYCPTETGGRGLPLYPWIRYERDIKRNGEPDVWIGKEADCDEPSEDDFVSIEEITTHIDYRVFQPLGDPDMDVHPGGRTLVNLPTVVSTNYPEGVGPPAEVLSLEEARVRIPIDIEKPGENLTGEIIAQADFQWQFEGAGAASGRGRPYEEGRTPVDSPGYYTTGTFTTTGSKTITLTATWTGEVTVETLAPEEIDPVVRQSSVELDVVESRSRLTDNN